MEGSYRQLYLSRRKNFSKELVLAPGNHWASGVFATNTTKTFKDVLSAIKNKGMQITTPVPGDSFKLGQADCKILAPNSSLYEDLNNFSVVIKVTFGNNSFMFDDDAEKLSETEMLNKGFNLKADVLKVGHQYVDSNGNGLIKGSKSKIYHVPGGNYYDKTTNVVQWFKTIEEAEAAGYRAPKN